jgi:long-chain fatty acid transport protein
MRKLKTFTVLLLILALSGQVLGSGYAVSGVGARALIMGGAFRAVADDWSAAYYNPAGLVNVFENQVTFGADIYSNRPTFTPDVTQNGYHLGYYDGEERVPNDKLVYTPYASGILVLPFYENMTFGLAVFQPFDYQTEWKLFHISPAYNPLVDDTLYDPVEEPMVMFPGEWSHRMNLDVIDFHPTFAMQLMEEKLSVGLGISIRKGTFFHDQLNLVPNDLAEPFSSRPYENFVQLSEVDASGWGFGANLGVLLNLNDKFSLGASYQTKTTIDLDGESITKFYSPYNRHLFNYADTGSLAEMIFSDSTTYQSVADIETEWTVPSEFGFGLSYQASDKVLVAADFSYTLWSEYEDMVFDTSNATGMTQYSILNEMLVPARIVNRWDDAFKLSLGVEGILNDKVTLRGGYCYDQSPIPNENATVDYGNPGDQHRFTGGGSLVVSDRVSFVGGLGFIFKSETEIESLEDLDSDGVFDNLAGTHSEFSLLASLSVVVKF